MNDNEATVKRRKKKERKVEYNEDEVDDKRELC